jgi:hypothetical protein
MSVSQPVKVPVKEISSVDVPNFIEGLFQNGAQNAPLNSFISSKDIELTVDGYITQRRNMQPFLPDTVESGFEKFPVSYGGELYFFTLDNDKVVYCKEGDTTWTICGGSNTVHTQLGGRPIMLRVLDSVLVLNGGNGDRLAYADLTTTGFPVVQYTPITDPTTALTVSGTNLSVSGTQPFSIYYAYSYTTTVGETLLSPIITVPINIVRDQWQTQSNPAKLTLTFHDTPPTGAQYRNVYVALAPTAGTIQSTDMLTIATQQSITATSFTDDGSLSINLGAVAPLTNSTSGPKVQYGIVENGNPILYGDPDNPSNIYIGGGGPYALDFSISNNGYTAQPEQGTNYYPTTVVGFRSGTGVPTITVLFSNTEGLSKQAILSQQTITYGDSPFSVWGLTEQHYGSAGVAAPNSAINYNGKLAFLSTDGFVTLDTAAQRLNVIDATNITNLPLGKFVKTIKPSAMPGVIGAGWNDKYMWTVPSNGFDTPQQVLVYDTSNGKTAFYTLNIAAQWIGVVTPQNEASFVYLCVGKSTYKLLDSTSTFDVIGGVNKAFSTNATGPLMGMGGEAHNMWQADVQAMFYILGLIGSITIGVNYRNQNGVIKTKQKTYVGPDFTPSSAGGWGDPGWTYANFPSPSLAGAPVLSQSDAAIISSDVRIPLQIDDIMSEAQWFINTAIAFNAFTLRAISYEGINLGVRPDLQ